MAAKKITIESPIRLRRVQKENQSQFWGRLGVAKSSGSRYESGRAVPKPVRMLIALATGKATVEQLQSGELAKRIGCQKADHAHQIAQAGR